MTSSWIACIATVLYIGLIVIGAFLPVPEEREESPLHTELWEES